MFVPSLSWQNVRFYVQAAASVRMREDAAARRGL
eukprot:COSAG06_NODE_5900_length_3222_cov_4.402498_1_plen_34_part_00